MPRGHRPPTIGQLPAAHQHIQRPFNIARIAGAGGATTLMMRATPPVHVHPFP
jgi:hypothetical protein